MGIWHVQHVFVVDVLVLEKSGWHVVCTAVSGAFDLIPFKSPPHFHPLVDRKWPQVVTEYSR